MLKKITLFAIAMMVGITSSYAQEQQKEQNLDEDRLEQYKNEDVGKRIIISKLYQNWEVSGRLGTQAYLGEYVHCYPYFNFKDWWTIPSFDLSLSKWGTQSIGLALGFTYSPFKSLYYTGEGSTEPKYATFAKVDDEVYYKDSKFNIARGKMGNAYISVIFNVCNIFGGYKKDRLYDLIASIGGGIMFPLSKTQYNDICSSFNAGLINKFNVGKHMSIDLAIRGTLHDDMFNGVSFYNSDDHTNLSVDATIGATAGVSYRFDFPRNKSKRTSKKNTEGWTSVNEVVPFTTPYMNLEHELSDANAEADAAKKALANKTNDTTTVVIREKEPFTYVQLVNFVIDKWDISNREKVAIMLAAKVINEHPSYKFRVQGFADIQTSYPEHNQFLSENRVNGVYKMLVEEFGVNPDQLIKSAHGGVDYMFFDDEQCSRSVLILSVPLDETIE